MKKHNKRMPVALLLCLVLLATLGLPAQRLAAQGTEPPLASDIGSEEQGPGDSDEEPAPAPGEDENAEEADEESPGEEPGGEEAGDGDETESPGEEEDEEDTEAPGEEEDGEETEAEEEENLEDGEEGDGPEEEDADGEETDEDGEDEDTGDEDEEEEDDLEEEDLLDELEISLLAQEIAPDSVIVYDYAELAEAIQGNNLYTKIYFGDDIEGFATSPAITIPATKSDLLISGTPPDGSGGPYTFTQQSSPDIGRTIQVHNAAVGSVTIADMNVVGQNFYGIVYVGVTGVTTTHRNLVYHGPQPAWNVGGTVVFDDCDVYLERLGPRDINELAECTHLVFIGEVNVVRDFSTSTSNANATFNITPANGSITVSPGANVTVNTTSYLVYSPSTPRTTFTVGAGATFTATAARGFGEQNVSRFTLENGAVFNFTQTGGSYSMDIGQSFTLNPGSTFVYDRTGAENNNAAIRMLAVGTVSFNSPQRVAILNRGPVISMGGSTIGITTGALNMWETNPGSINTGTPPTYQWNKLGRQSLTLSSTFSGATTGPVTTNLVYDPANPFANDPANAPLTNATFRPANAYMMVMGETPLGIDTVTSQSRAVTGTADAGPVYASYTSGGVAASAEATAAGGGYSIPLATAADADTYFTVDSFATRLWSRQFVQVQEAEGAVYFVSVPDALPFDGGEIPTEATYVYRQQPGWALQVADERFTSTGFSVYASINAPLAANLGGGQTSTLEDALVFVDANGAAQPLSDADLKIYSSTETTGGTFTISWANNRGPLLYVTPGNIRAGVEYSTTITWTLEDVP